MSYNYERTASADDGLLVCPECTEPLSVESVRCTSCEFEGRKRDGIVTFHPDTVARPTETLDTDELEELAMLAEKGTLRDATNTVLEDHEHQSAVLSDMYSVERDAWCAFAAEHVTGRCLDLHAGFGRRSMVLSELAETVYAVDPNLTNVRITAERDDYESAESVVPIHTSEDRLPFADGSLDTIVTDFTGNNAAETRRGLSRVRSYLDDDGTLLFTADGWTRQTGLTDVAGLEREGTNGREGLSLDLEGSRSGPGTVDGYRSLGRELGFDDVSIYALFPTATRPLYAFDVDNEHAVDKLSEFVFPGGTWSDRLGRSALTVGNRYGLLNRCYPGYLVVYSNEPKPSSFDFSDPLLVAGRARSVVLDMSDDGIDRVYKIPNRSAHAPLSERENSILSALGAGGEPITDTFPEGRAVETRFGTGRVEQPVEGHPLSTDLEDDVESFDRVLEVGFDWLTEFQRTFRGESIVQSPGEVREELRFEPTDLEPPTVDEPLETFRTPVHGDYIPQNIHVRDGDVTGVIDWEYGATEANPIIDAGFLVLCTAHQVFERFEDAFRTVLCEQNEYADRAKSRIRAYCDELDLPYRAFEIALPSVYLHRLKLDWRFGAVSTYSTRMDERVRLVEYMFDNASDVSISR